MSENENETVPDDAEEDLPFPSDIPSKAVATTLSEENKTIEHAPKTEDIDPEKKHAMAVEDFKNGSALKIVIGCLGCIAFFALCEFSKDGSTGAMDATSETLKVVATTALGFLFGRNSK